MVVRVWRVFLNALAPYTEYYFDNTKEKLLSFRPGTTVLCLLYSRLYSSLKMVGKADLILLSTYNITFCGLKFCDVNI